MIFPFANPGQVILYALIAWGLYLLACAFLPNWFIFRSGRRERTQLELEDTYRKTIAQVLGGSALVFTFLWTFIKDSESLDQARAQTANQLFSDASKQIADKDAKLRASAAYLLGQVAVSRVEFNNSVTKLLVALLPTGDPKTADPSRQIGATRPHNLDIDGLAIIDVLNHHDPSLDEHPLNLEQRYLVGGDFRGHGTSQGFKGADLQSAFLYNADFRGADLTNTLFGGSLFADYQSYGLDTWNKDQDNPPSATDDWVRWQRFQFIARFEFATLNGTQFVGTDLSGAIFCGADFKGAVISNSNLSRVDFQGAKNLVRAKFKDDNCADEAPVFTDGKIPSNIVLHACQVRTAQPAPIRRMPAQDCVPDQVDSDLKKIPASAPPNSLR